MSTSAWSRRTRRHAAAGLLAALAVLGPVGGADALPCWAPPVTAPVTDPFRAPPCRYCAGNRGIEYDVSPGTAVLSVQAGTVSFSGVVAGTRYVVVELANGWRLTYGQLDGTTLHRGDVVLAGTRVGMASNDLFFGLRVGGEYRDPAEFLGELVGWPRLVPTDASPARPAPPPRLRCGVPRRR